MNQIMMQLYVQTFVIMSEGSAGLLTQSAVIQNQHICIYQITCLVYLHMCKSLYVYARDFHIL